MTYLRRIFALVTVCGACCFGQSLSADQFDFFNHLFKTIADPLEDPTNGRDPMIFQRRENTEATRYGLNQSETALLHAVAQSYYALAVQWQDKIAANRRRKDGLVRLGSSGG